MPSEHHGPHSAEVDPVCGMRVSAAGEFEYLYRGASYRFCTLGAWQNFKPHPSNTSRHPEQPQPI
jgi:YHS domain-containing protein